MPRYIRHFEHRSWQEEPLRSSAHGSGHEQLVKQLVAELTTSANALQPLILEDRALGHKERRVYVIWDELARLSADERSALIYNAYRQAEGEETAAHVVVATGVTSPEAVALGLLPYEVRYRRPKLDRRPPEVYHNALAKEALRSVAGKTTGEVRYARREDAEAARQRLKKALRGSSWSIRKDEGYKGSEE